MRALLVFLALLISTPSLAKVKAPEPPAQNPHAAVTPADKARVEAATLAINTFLAGTVSQAWLRESVDYKGLGTLRYADKDLRCLRSARCWRTDTAFGMNISAILKSRGKLVEFRYPHVIPWSMKNFKKHQGMHHHHHGSKAHLRKSARKFDEQPMAAPALKHDEFMVHLYARFENTGWQHVDVIMTEGKDGKPAVRYFFATTMRPNLPPGVRC